MRKINEVKCTFKHAGREFTNRGAYLDNNGGSVYIVERDGHIVATTWHGELISANVQVISEWSVYSRNIGSYKMRSVRFSVGGNMTYSGRYGCDWSQLCRVKRVRSTK